MTHQARTRLLFVGDTSFGENYQARAARRGGVDVLATRGYESILGGLSDLLASADLTIANLETPLSLPTEASMEGRKKYVHWSDPRRATAVLRRHGFGAVSLGNNHACDQGEPGLRSTLESLRGAGIEAFGAGCHGTEAARPFDRSFDVDDSHVRLTVVGGQQRRENRTSDGDESDIQPYAGAAAGVHGMTRGAEAVRVHALRQSDPGRLIVAFPHWGRNYKWAANRQRRMAHALIDAGADVVLGHGSHMMGEIECHRGRWIVYSLGNFVFGAPGRYAKIEGAVPFSFAACLDVVRIGGPGSDIDLSLRLYPICTDNRVTDYRPRVVTTEEATEVHRVLADRCTAGELVRRHWTKDCDHLGPYLQTPLATLTGFVRAHAPTRILHDDALSTAA